MNCLLLGLLLRATGAELRFMAVGDIMIGRGVSMRLKKWMAFAIMPCSLIYMNMGDVVFANLESPHR